MKLCVIEKKKEPVKAINSLKAIIESKCVKDKKFNSKFDDLLILDEENEYIYELMGELYTKCGEREKALECYQFSYFKYPNFSSWQVLFSENKTPEDNTKENKNVKVLESETEEKYLYKYFTDRIKFNENQDKSILKVYSKYVPGIGSYFLSDAAKEVFEMGKISESQEIFENLRKKDPNFIEGMEIYSTVLWHTKDITNLVVLCRDLIKNFPDEKCTWAALGNYFSFKNDHHRAILCFKRSLIIEKDYYVYSLLGHESMLKNEYSMALKYFLSSLKMQINNYNATFGCGIVYSKTDKSENAGHFFSKAISLNPKNQILKLLTIQFHIKNNEFQKAIEVICETFGLLEKENLSKIYKELIDNLNVLYKRDEPTDLILLEFIDILINNNMVDCSSEILNFIRYRGRSYYLRRSLIFEKMGNSSKSEETSKKSANDSSVEFFI